MPEMRPQPQLPGDTEREFPFAVALRGRSGFFWCVKATTYSMMVQISKNDGTPPVASPSLRCWRYCTNPGEYEGLPRVAKVVEIALDVLLPWLCRLGYVRQVRSYQSKQSDRFRLFVVCNCRETDLT